MEPHSALEVERLHLSIPLESLLTAPLKVPSLLRVFELPILMQVCVLKRSWKHTLADGKFTLRSDM